MTPTLIIERLLTATAALFAACLALPLHAAELQAEIRWAQYGIPHVKASSYAGLGYGYGYAVTRDALCEIVDRVLTLRGERSVRFGPGVTMVGFTETSNLNSDLFYREMLSDAAVGRAYRQLSSDARSLAKGYAAGFNRYVREAAAAKEARPCKGADMPQMGPMDVVRAMMQIGTVWEAKDVAAAASQSTWESLTVAAKPGPPTHDSAEVNSDPPLSMVSNAWAYGSDATDTGAAIVVSNPHSFWQPHWLHMHEMHLTIPGVLDVMGADFLGLPVPVTGFTHDVAWSIEAPLTVTYHVLLALNVKEGPRPSYEIDGRRRQITLRRIELAMRSDDGTLSKQTFRIPHTVWGPMYRLDAASGRAAGWYALTDANEGNAQGIDQMLAVAAAGNVREFARAVESHRGIPAHLIAGDKFGEATYVESGPLLDIDDLTLHRCAASPPAAQQGVSPAASNILDGKQGICAGRTTDGRPKLAAADRIPTMVTRGIVYNMNDSYHRSLYGQNRGGYSELLGDPSRSPGMRKLMAQRSISEYLAAGRITEAAATEIMLSDRNYAAETTLDGILGACRSAAASSEAARACSILAVWDRRNNADSRGALMFRAAWPLLEVIPGFYAEPFDPATPFRERTVATGPTVVTASLADLKQGEMALRAVGLRGDEPWGDMLARPTPHGRVPLHGGGGNEGILNALTGARLQSNGFSDIVLGTSYVHVVTWENGHVHAKVMLAHGQSLDPNSRHFADQLPMFAQKRLADAEFTDSEISADPALDVLRLRE